jgi:hypothetical protein
MEQDPGPLLLLGKGTSLWRHTEDTSWDVQGRLEEWETTLGQVVARHTRSGSLRPRRAKKMAGKTWRLVVDPQHKAPWGVRRRLKAKYDNFITAAQESLGDVVAGALEVDASRFRQHLITDPDLVEQIERNSVAIAALLHGEAPQLESVPDLDTAALDDEPVKAVRDAEHNDDA